MKQSLHFNTYYDDYKFQISTKVHDWFNDKTVKEDIIYKTKDFLETIKYIASKQYKVYLFDLLLHSVYYMSKCDFWKLYCKNDIDDYILDDIFEHIFGTEILIYRKYLQAPQYTETYFKILYHLQESMIRYCVDNNSSKYIKDIQYNF